MYVQNIGMNSSTNIYCLPVLCCFPRGIEYNMSYGCTLEKITLSSTFCSFILPSMAHPLTLRYVQWCSMARECLREMWKKAQQTRLPSLMPLSAKEKSPHSGARGSSQTPNTEDDCIVFSRQRVSHLLFKLVGTSGTWESEKRRTWSI